MAAGHCRFADKWDILMMICGLIGGAGNGALGGLGILGFAARVLSAGGNWVMLGNSGHRSPCCLPPGLWD